MTSFNSTIVAPATAMVAGGVGIIRLSGTKAKKIGETISKKQLIHQQAIPSNFYCQNQAIDFGLVVFFANPKSLTGEDIVELQCHGSLPVIQQLIKECCLLGATLARAGEFLERSFLNDKIDLVQAEAIADLISSSTESQAKACFNSLLGSYSKELNTLRQALISLRIKLESAIDFSDQEIDEATIATLNQELAQALSKCTDLLSQTKAGIGINKTCSLLLLGLPNVGKSSLFNLLNNKQKAIVTDMAGTTRDLLISNMQIEGIPIEIIDSAGLYHKSQDEIEKIGIAKSLAQIEQADIICWLYTPDISSTQALEQVHEFVDSSHRHKIILVKNKCDTLGKQPKCSQVNYKNKQYEEVSISALEQLGIDLLAKLLAKKVHKTTDAQTFSANHRHMHKLEKVYHNLNLGLDNLANNAMLDLVSEDVKVALEQLDEILGGYHTEELLGDIFSNFCIGK